jgi:hypothetical protein
MGFREFARQFSACQITATGASDPVFERANTMPNARRDSIEKPSYSHRFAKAIFSRRDYYRFVSRLLSFRNAIR